MNERDIQLVRTIDSEIQLDDNGPIYVLSSKYTNLVRINLVVLKAFLDVKRLRGVIITIDRPHQYISHLLQLHGIDQTNLTAIDAISSHSSDTKAGSVATEFQKGPFQIETLPEFLFSDDGAKKCGVLNSTAIDFIVIDNVSTMLTYNTMDSVKKFFSKYVELIAQAKPRPIVTVLAMDKELYKELFGIVSGLSRKIIDVGPDMAVTQIMTAEQLMSGLQPSMQMQVTTDLSRREFDILKNSKGVM